MDFHELIALKVLSALVLNRTEESEQIIYRFSDTFLNNVVTQLTNKIQFTNLRQFHFHKTGWRTNIEETKENLTHSCRNLEIAII